MLAPAVTVCEAGVADREKSAAALTTRVTVVEWVSAPLVPMIVSVNVPVGVVAEVVTLIVLLPDPATEVGANVAAAPAGSPLALKVTVPVNPFVGVTVAV